MKRKSVKCALGRGSTPSSEPRAVLFVRRLSSSEGIDHFVAAAQFAAKEASDVRFIAAGSPNSGFAAPMARAFDAGFSLDLRARHLSNAELVQLIEDARVVVLPYVDASQSGVVLTAYALERSVITTDVGGLSDYVLDGVTGEVVAPGNDDQPAAATVRACLEPGLLVQREKGVAALVAGETAWSGIADEVLVVYERAACRRRKPA